MPHLTPNNNNSNNNSSSNHNSNSIKIMDPPADAYATSVASVDPMDAVAEAAVLDDTVAMEEDSDNNNDDHDGDDDDDDDDAEEDNDASEVVASVIVDDDIEDDEEDDDEEEDDDDDDDDDDDGEDPTAAVISSSEPIDAIPVVAEAEATPVAAVPVRAIAVATAVPADETPVEAVAVKPKTTSKKKKSTGGRSSSTAAAAAQKKKKKNKKSSAKASTGKSTSDSKNASAAKKKKRKKPSSSSKATNTTSSSSLKEDIRWSRIAPARLNAAARAREYLVGKVPTLPHVSEDGTIRVRSFGRLCIEASADYGNQPHVDKFSKANALYPIGYSCDRYEFSPVHGRILKMRCSILDGRKITEKQIQMGVANPRTDLPNGPVFRIMWGQGIDEDIQSVSYPYDPYSMSAPLSATDEVDAVAVPSTAAAKRNSIPRVGMQVKSVFDHGHLYHGTITKIIRPDDNGEAAKKKKRKKIVMEILYDDGSTEVADYPDPDISLISPEAEPELDSNGNVEYEELKGLPVYTVVGASPVEAWGKVLTKLGLTDEFMVGSAMQNVATSRQMGLQEAKEKVESKYSRKPTTSTAPKISPAPLATTSGDPPEMGITAVTASTAAAAASASTAATSTTTTTSIPLTQSNIENRGQPVLPTSSAPTSNGAAPPPVTTSEDGKTSEPQRIEEGEEDVKTETKLVMSPAEVELQSKLAVLCKELETAKAEGRAAAVELAEKRINVLGKYLANPFPNSEGSLPQQATWLALAVKKEKSKMGSTGNKKKIVSATDLLERNDTFFNAEIESLIEGLPGSEYCSSYIFLAMRSGGFAATTRAWVHEAQVRTAKEREKRLQAQQDKKTKMSQLAEKQTKRRKIDDIRDERKRQRIEEEDEKKRARIDERIARLDVQVDERLFKEACFQREKAILALAKSFVKDYAKRRKAAELVAGQSVVDAKRIRRKPQTILLPLPAKLSKVYDEDVLRVWDFMTTFGDYFEKRGYVESAVSMDSLQSAIDSLRGTNCGPVMPRETAIKSLTGLAVALCQPLAATQTRLLFASLIALYPVLQKDFGASFFNELNEVAVDEDKEFEKREDSIISSPITDLILPVNEMTWQEIARTQFLADGFEELGTSRQDTAHHLRGYRSAGHPNSKESRRIRRAEDFCVALLRQQLASGTQTSKERTPTIARIEAPTIPSCLPTDWIFYLHNVKHMKSSDTKSIIINIKKSLELLKSSEEMDVELESQLSGWLKQVERENGSFKEIKQEINDLLDSRASPPPRSTVDTKDGETTNKTNGSERPQRASFRRQHMGLLEDLSLTKPQLKKLMHAREAYMAEALKLKEDMERKQKRNQNKGGDNDEDDEDDDDDDDYSNDGSATNSIGKAEASTPAEVAAAVVASEEKSDVKSKAVSQGSSPTENGDVPVAINADIEAKTTSDDISTEKAKSESDKKPAANVHPSLPAKIGKPTEYDDFCEDIPHAPELIRRCLAVLRALTAAGPAEAFHYPVDPQVNPGYYDMVLRPMCLWKAGKIIQQAVKDLSAADTQNASNFEAQIEDVVFDFGRNMRLIARNTLAYANAGPMIVSAGCEFLNVFERLFLDWVLAPPHELVPLDDLDDDRCVDHHPSDETSTVLLCDSCEGNFNIARLDPPLKRVPQGDWFCPRCVSGRWWGHIDPRIGKTVQRKIPVPDAAEGGSSILKGKIKGCGFVYPEGRDPEPSLVYEVKMVDGTFETWPLRDVDESLQKLGDAVPRVRCIRALAESQGYGCHIPDKTLVREMVPVPLNPSFSDAAARSATSSSVFRDTILACGTLMLTSPEDMKASEWLRLLLLLVMKASSSDVMQNLASKMETEAAEEMAKYLESLGKVKRISDIFDPLDDDDDEVASGEQPEQESNASGGDEEDAEMLDVSDSPNSKQDTGSELKKEASRSATPTSMRSLSPMNGQPAESMTTSVAEASAVEVVSGLDGAPATTGADMTAEPKEIVVVDPIHEKRTRALALKARRAKAREDSISAFSMKSQLRPTVASFDEDAVSHVIDTALASKHPGLSFASTRCRQAVCDFCGLTDIALGTPLVRVPDDNEWNELIPHASNSRRVHLIAKMSDKGIDDDDESEDMDVDSAKKKQIGKMVSLTIRVSDDLVSVKEKAVVFDRTSDGGMLEFCPRNKEGFQNELRFRSDHRLPYVSGSLTAHECCAISVHKARKVDALQRFKERQLDVAESIKGRTCGRTLAIGKDAYDRYFWKFHKDPDSLFVFEPSREDDNAGAWHKFSDPASIASIMSGLGKDAVVRELKIAFPDAAKVFKDGTWSNEILKRHFPNALLARETDDEASVQEADSASKSKSKNEMESSEEEEVPFEVGEKVLVESKSGKLLWAASVTAVTRSKDDGPVVAYRVHYKGWSGRFDEWVEPDRLVEPSENNLQVQEEMLEEAAAKRDGLPPALNNMEAHKYLRSQGRARGSAFLPDFATVAHTPAGASSDEQTFALLKAAVLLVELALPLGAVDVTSRGAWRPDVSKLWRVMVEEAQSSTDLMRYLIMLEDCITEQWFKQDVGHLRNCLPDRWLAIEEANVSSLAVRIQLLDRCLLYGTVDLHLFVEKGSKTNKK